MRHPIIGEIVKRDRRFAYEAYEFVFEALAHTQVMVGRTPSRDEKPGTEHHVSGPEIVRGAVDLARNEFGMMARTVFQQWGITRSADLGEIVFNMIDNHLLSKTEADCKADFDQVFDLNRALVEGFTIPMSPEANASVSRGATR